MSGPVVNGEQFAPGYTPEAAAYEQATRPVPPIDPECDRTHLFGLPAIESLFTHVAPVPATTPVMRCDQCVSDGWWDWDAAAAVARASGGTVVVVEDEHGPLQWFVTPEVLTPSA